MRKLLLMGALACTLFLSGCSMVDEYFLPPPDDTVQEIFEAGNDAMREKNYSQAITYYTRIKDEYPFSPYVIESELALADAHYLDGEYLLASEAYKDFETLHPRHEAIPYVLYQLGMSLKKSYTSIDHSATAVNEAVEYFTRLQQEYPDTEYGKNAAERIAECRKTLAQREIFIANVFWGMENYQAAWTRYQHVVRTYPDVKEEAEYAKTKGEAAYLKYRQEEGQNMRELQQGSWKDWFRWL
ncbi:outer membrane protein assembly factor BamD [Mailhella massiliensis]|uniref:Outer membrane protein assembly factor BamD n=1 Tax=Mailhella massiliensis TaxID=1903261 RepID=A0A921AXJ2_9BACT|nr:outer membrane protein assembly factor BamD [Mailhella massiliensis]HJD98157.1 outer membrane protein assembly factor BamD [Mailhella massiliensis]